MLTLAAGKVLVVDDSPATRRDVAAILRGAPDVGAVREAGDGYEALQAMQVDPPDLVLCDLQMPRCDGLVFLRLLSRVPRLSATPVVLLTAAQGGEARAQLFEAGASDFILKPFDPRELLARIRIHLRSKLQRDELARINARLEELSSRDALTNIGNRRHLDALLATELARVDRGSGPLSIAMVDLDHFKQINDSLGHSEGDLVLREVAEVLRTSIRVSDAVCRFGGEEFAVLLPNTGGPGARVLAERLRARIAAHVLPSGRRVTASLGLATATAGAARLDAATLLQRADAALYAAKRTGRNCVRSWGDVERAGAGAPAPEGPRRPSDPRTPGVGSAAA